MDLPGPQRPVGGAGQLELLEHAPGPLLLLGPAQMLQPRDQLEVSRPVSISSTAAYRPPVPRCYAS